MVNDANILFASLIKPGLTAKLILSDKFQFVYPEFLLEEFYKYKPIILKKTHRTSEEVDHYFSIIKKRIRIIPILLIRPFIRQATVILPDPKDTVYLALAMKCNCSV